MKLLSPALLRGISTLAILLLVAACASKRPAVHSDFDKAVNFATYKTFGFPETTSTDRGGYTTLVTSHFKEAIRHEMTARGYVYAETAPDLQINFYSEMRDKARVYSNPGWIGGGYWGYGYYGHPRYGYYSAWPFFYDQGIDVVEYRTGTIRLDVVDAARKQVVWEANVEEELTDKAQDNPQPTIARLVTALFRKFPRGANAT
jgi:hypothetical protein